MPTPPLTREGGFQLCRKNPQLPRRTVPDTPPGANARSYERRSASHSASHLEAEKHLRAGCDRPGLPRPATSTGESARLRVESDSRSSVAPCESSRDGRLMSPAGDDAPPPCEIGRAHV